MIWNFSFLSSFAKGCAFFVANFEEKNFFFLHERKTQNNDNVDNVIIRMLLYHVIIIIMFNHNYFNVYTIKCWRCLRLKLLIVLIFRKKKFEVAGKTHILLQSTVTPISTIYNEYQDTYGVHWAYLTSWAKISHFIPRDWHWQIFSLTPLELYWQLSLHQSRHPPSFLSTYFIYLIDGRFSWKQHIKCDEWNEGWTY